MDTPQKPLDIAARIRRPVKDEEIPALRLACLQAALAAVATDAGRMTGVHRDISRLIRDDPEFRRRLAERIPAGPTESGPYRGCDAPRGNWTGD